MKVGQGRDVFFNGINKSGNCNYSVWFAHRVLTDAVYVNLVQTIKRNTIYTQIQEKRNE